jgi:dipeptidase E
MKLFIASTFANTVKLFVEKQRGGRVLFIANSCDPFKNKYWVNKDYQAFVENGSFEIERCDLRKMDALALEDKLQGFQILHVCGGSVLYMLDLLHKKGMHIVIQGAIRRGVIYTGTSAGSIIMAPDVSFGADDIDEHEAGVVGKVKDFRGLGMIPYFPQCHAQEEYYFKSIKRVIPTLSKNKVPILFLNDNMACWHVDGKMFIEQL